MIYNSNLEKDLKAFVRIDGMGRVVAGSLILRKNKPKVGRWQQIPTYQCCHPTTFAPGGDDPGTTSTSTTPPGPPPPTTVGPTTTEAPGTTTSTTTGPSEEPEPSTTTSSTTAVPETTTTSTTEAPATTTSTTTEEPTTTTSTTEAPTTTTTTTESGDLVFLAELIGENEVPAVPTAAFGDATVVINTVTNIASLVVGYTGLVPTGAHIHFGAAGIDGPIVITLDHTMNPIAYTSPPLTPEQESDLIAGMYYINLHTAAYPDGEIRGQFFLI